MIDPTYLFMSSKPPICVPNSFTNISANTPLRTPWSCRDPVAVEGGARRLLAVVLVKVFREEFIEVFVKVFVNMFEVFIVYNK